MYKLHQLQAKSTHLSVMVGLYGSLCLIEAICVTVLPETGTGDIPDTIEEARMAFSKKAKSAHQRQDL